MANPVKYSGVEDVLTSIRRLVSEDAGHRRVPAATGEWVESKGSDRLVLTAALRVSGVGAPAGIPAPPPAVDPPAAAPRAAPEEKRLAAAPADDHATPNDAGAHDRESLPGAAAAAGADADPGASAILRERRLHLAAPTASGYYENEHALERSPVAADEIAGGADGEDDQPAVAAGDGARTGAGEAESDGGDGGDGGATRPDGPETCPPEDVAPQERLRLVDDETALVDEQMLHDMVVDVVREELQGKLGERITRNVRKLVRREVFRALATLDFE